MPDSGQRTDQRSLDNSRPQSRLLDGSLRRAPARHSAGMTGVIKKDHIAYMILLMLREIGFILDRGLRNIGRFLRTQHLITWSDASSFKAHSSSVVMSGFQFPTGRRLSSDIRDIPMRKKLESISGPDLLSLSLLPSRAFPRCSINGIHYIHGIAENCLKKHACDVHHADRVLKSGVHCAGVEEVRPSQLSYPSKPLEYGVINQPTFPFVHRNKTVNRATDFIVLAVQDTPPKGE